MCAEGHFNTRWGKIEYTEDNLSFDRKERKMVSTTGTNWSAIIDSVGRETLEEFANGSMSAKEFYGLVTYSSVGSEVRSLLRDRGATYARRLARKALSRR
jgi:hypothetical protein